MRLLSYSSTVIDGVFLALNLFCLFQYRLPSVKPWKCEKCPEKIKIDPIHHEYLQHTPKTSSYVCTCGYGTVKDERMRYHLESKHQLTLDVRRCGLDRYWFDGLPEFTHLYQCKRCHLFTPINDLIKNHDCSVYILGTYDMPLEFNLFNFMPEGYKPYQPLLHPPQDVDCPALELSLDESMECEPSDIAEDLQKGLACAKPAEDRDSAQEESKKGLACAKPAEDRDSAQEGFKKGLACAKPAEDRDSAQEGSMKGLVCAKPAEDRDSAQEGSKKGLDCAKPAEDQDSAQEFQPENSSKRIKVLDISKTKDYVRPKKNSDLESSKSKKTRPTHCTDKTRLPQLNWSRGLKPSEYFVKRTKPAKKPYDAKLHQHTMNFARALDAKLGYDSSVSIII